MNWQTYESSVDHDLIASEDRVVASVWPSTNYPGKFWWGVLHVDVHGYADSLEEAKQLAIVAYIAARMS